MKPVAPGNTYESRDRRERGRRVFVLRADPDKPYRWICAAVINGRTKQDRTCKLSDKNLQKRWTLVDAGGDSLQPLLTRLRDVHPSDLPASLIDLRAAWLKAGCPGLLR